jgi:putative radical SAM enzyme (TIGR03279 family)
VVAVAPGSPAARADVEVGDVLVAINGQPVRDVIQYRVMGDDDEVVLDLDRGGIERVVEIEKPAGEPLGIEVASAVFDEVRTCDNHCEFCFIYQLPPGMRRSLYVKDDDYRLSFLYGNFTTLTRFTESDLERVVTEGLSPLYVSIHATNPDVRTDLLRNRRGAMSLRWLRALLDHGVEVHGQIVVCPGLNDGDVLDDTMAGILDEYHELADVAVVPLGVSRFNSEPRMRPHTRDEASRVIDVVESWQDTFMELLGRPLAFAADEYYLLAGRPFPSADRYGDFDMHEDGIGMARAFELEFSGATDGDAIGVQPGFFAWVDGAPAEGYRAPRWEADTQVPVTLGPSRRGAIAIDDRPVGVLTGPLGARVLDPLLATVGRDDVRLVPVENRFFGGNIGVTGLMVGEDVVRVLSEQPEGHRYLLPDVCLSNGTFLDGVTVGDLPRPVEVLPTDGVALRRALERSAA